METEHLEVDIDESGPRRGQRENKMLIEEENQIKDGTVFPKKPGLFFHVPLSALVTAVQLTLKVRVCEMK